MKMTLAGSALFLGGILLFCIMLGMGNSGLLLLIGAAAGIIGFGMLMYEFFWK